MIFAFVIIRDGVKVFFDNFSGRRYIFCFNSKRIRTRCFRHDPFFSNTVTYCDTNSIANTNADTYPNSNTNINTHFNSDSNKYANPAASKLI